MLVLRVSILMVCILIIYNYSRSCGQVQSDRGSPLHNLSGCFVTAFIGAGVMSVAVGYITCEQRDVAVALLSVAVMFTGLCRAGYNVNHVDFAPK